MVNPVADYYDQNPELEWNRLVTSPYRRMEYEVVLYFLEQFLPPAGHILDLGGGPGRYAVYLAKRGYQVTLVDLAPENIRFAREKSETRIVEQVQGFIPRMQSIWTFSPRTPSMRFYVSVHSTIFPNSQTVFNACMNVIGS